MTCCRPTTLLVWVLISGLAPQMIQADSDPTDDRKKEIVYRMYAGYKKDFPTVKDMSPREAMQLLNEGRVVFVDTRQPAEIGISRLPQAIPRAAFLKDPAPYRDKAVVVYCTISYRSGLLAAEMAARGIAVYNLIGGILAWTLEGGKVYDDRGETKRIHVYGPKWDYAPAGYETVMFGFWDKMF
ncbi:MAG: rhodanese-like domain-containing protein [Desulfobacterales bacterium]|nr:MAG: rhodanese-like domain-containing protein [Desulfobacterales bacterium]